MKTLFHLSKPRTTRLRQFAAVAALGLAALSTPAQLLYQEGFNTDGEAANPKRYTTEGRDAYEVARIRSELGLQDQLGPVYWAHNFDVSFVGVPGPTSGRRALMAWDPTISDASTISEQGWQLMLSTIKWLAKDKAGARIIAYPDAFTIGALAEKLTEAGYTVVDDDPNVTDQNLATVGDVLIHAGSANPSRGAQAPIGVAAMISADHDDLLTGSIGTAANFTPGNVTIAAASHPAAGGLTGSFSLTESSYNWQLLGEVLPNGATVLANFVQQVVPTISSIADIDAMIAGTKQSVKTTETLQALDFSDGSPGNWQSDNAVPGGAAGVWAIRAQGKLQVTAAGTYSFALGTDDGGRVRIDRNRNGLDAGDTIITDAGPHGHQVMYGNAAFPASGAYDFEVIAYNSGGGGGVEFSVANTAGSGKTDLIDLPEAWSNVGDPSSTGNVTAQGDITVDAYVAAGDVQENTIPFIVLLNGPQDSPPGAVFGGGPFTGFEGTGFFGMAGGNKFPFPDGMTDRTLTLAPINVSGKTDLKLTIALAATFLDFETSDYLDIIAFPNGLSSTPVRLARYAAPTGSTKYFTDVDQNNANRLGLEFKDATYNIPPGASELVIQIRAISTWWNEILAFDNIRITSGAITPTAATLSASKAGAAIKLDITGGTPPFLVQAAMTLPGAWIDVVTTSSRTVTFPHVGPAAFFRVVSATDKDVDLYLANLTGDAERPTAVVTPGKGAGFVSVNTATKAATVLAGYSNLKQNATAAHIHGPADVNTAAGVLQGLSPLTPVSTSGLYGFGGILNEATYNALTAGMTYLNIHSGAHGGGEIRGQLVPLPQ